jgi:hypothetical protein
MLFPISVFSSFVKYGGSLPDGSEVRLTPRPSEVGSCAIGHGTMPLTTGIKCRNALHASPFGAGGNRRNLFPCPSL